MLPVHSRCPYTQIFSPHYIWQYWRKMWWGCINRYSGEIIKSTTIALLFCLTPIAYADQLTGRVVGITDGDTITILTDQKKNIKIRLAEIDAPEKNQPWGKNSKQALSDLIFSSNVTVDSVGKDQYGRTLGTVFLNDMNINKHMVQHGNAWAYQAYVYDHSYIILQKRARTLKVRLGSMSENKRVAPWV